MVCKSRDTYFDSSTIIIIAAVSAISCFWAVKMKYAVNNAIEDGIVQMKYKHKFNCFVKKTIQKQEKNTVNCKRERRKVISFYNLFYVSSRLFICFW